MIPLPIDIILDYFRTVCYAIVVLTDLRGIAERKFSNILYGGDIVIAVALIAISFNSGFGTFDTRSFADFIGTPAAVIWAGIHFYVLLKKT